MARKRAQLKRKKSWLPENKQLRYALIGTFILIVGIAGYVVIRQSFAYSSFFTYYSQKDPKWANKPYPYIAGTRNQSDIALKRSGCAPTSMAMVASSLKKTVTPYEIGQWYGPRYHTSDGTLQSVYAQFARDFGLKYASLGSFQDGRSRAAIQNKLNSGRTLVIVSVGKGYFTSSGHVMVIRDFNPKTNQYLIADPNNSSNNRWFLGINLVNANLGNAYSFTR